MRERHSLNEEPLTITARDVIQLLKSTGYERYASYVSMLANDTAQRVAVERHLREQCDALLARLHVYEPPTKRDDDYRYGKPTAMSDG